MWKLRPASRFISRTPHGFRYVLMKKSKRFISLFGGIGGFDLALLRKGWECADYYEIDKHCCAVYNRNFKTDYKPTDITKVKAEEIPDHELLVAGFPCQAFSGLGARKGFKDARGQLFFEIVRIARAKKPSYLLLENVEGLRHHDNGRTLGTILQALGNCGYRCQWGVVDSRRFTGQSRRRLFIVAYLSKKGFRKIFPLKSRYGAMDKRDVATQKTAFRCLTTKPPKHCLHDSTVILDHGKLRVLTPIECERLQGFPDNWTAGLSDFQRYRQLGNAVSVPVIEAILDKLFGT